MALKFHGSEFFEENKHTFSLMKHEVLTEIQSVKNQQQATDQKVDKIQNMLKDFIKSSNETENLAKMDPAELEYYIIEPINACVDRKINPFLKNIEQKLDLFVSSSKLENLGKD